MSAAAAAASAPPPPTHAAGDAPTIASPRDHGVRAIAKLALAPAGVVHMPTRFEETYTRPHQIFGYFVRGDIYTTLADGKQGPDAFLDIVYKPIATLEFFGQPRRERDRLVGGTSLAHSARALVKMWATFYELGKRCGQTPRMLHVKQVYMNDRAAAPDAQPTLPDRMENARALFTDGTIPDWMDFLPMTFIREDAYVFLPPAPTGTSHGIVPNLGSDGHPATKAIYRYMTRISEQMYVMQRETYATAMAAFIYTAEHANVKAEASGRVAAISDDVLWLIWEKM